MTGCLMSPGSHPRVFELIRSTLRSSPLFTVHHRRLFSIIFPFSCLHRGADADACVAVVGLLIAFQTWSGGIFTLARKCV